MVLHTRVNLKANLTFSGTCYRHTSYFIGIFYFFSINTIFSANCAVFVFVDITQFTFAFLHFQVFRSLHEI